MAPARPAPHPGAPSVRVEELAVRHQRGQDRIRDLLVRAGVEIRPKGRPAIRDARAMTGTRRDMLTTELAGRYRAGASLDDLAVLCRCSPSKVGRILRAAGVELRPRARRPADKPDP